ncbi:MAG TPA: 23S rRNA (uracil(1939)-C(5))-methyltransferase RlmD [Acidobacteriota bacterium]|nr:23S rRNA (uracil(1939)-C(5))-methyltransferase RlmD [Acidobacteriota bacterium]
MLKKGDLIQLTLDTAAFEGVAVGRVDDFVVFVPHGVPGDRVQVRVVRKRKRHAHAVIEQILNHSPDRIVPRCRYFGVCGGCSWQHVEYDRQLAFKREHVRDLLKRIGGLEGVEVAFVVPSPSPYYYRNKMEFTFGSSRWLTRQEIESGQELDRDFALGLHVPKRFDRILDLEECHLQGSLSHRMVNFTRHLSRQEGWEAYDTRRNEGFLRNLVIRIGVRTGQQLINIVTRDSRPAAMELLSSSLLEEFPSITTIINSINPGRSPVASGEQQIYYGDGYIMEEIANLKFKVTATAFFQPNTLQAGNLFRIIRELAGLQGNETVYDLYTGLGAIALFLARDAERVVGVENHSDSIRLASENAELNQIENCVFREGDVAEVLDRDWVRRHGQPHVVIVDPPRVGLAEKAVASLLSIRPKRIVYSSCNPATQARDLQMLAEAYHIVGVHPVDMFPQTYHIENVALLERRMLVDSIFVDSQTTANLSSGRN